MTTVTIEFPEPLTRDIQERNISDERLVEAILQFVHIYVKEQGITTTFSDQTWSDPVEFTKGLIAKHRKVFEELARQ